MSGLTADQYAKLVQKNRAKAIGVPWSDEEAKARASGVSAEDIRSGVWKSGVKVETPPSVEVHQTDATAKEIKVELISPPVEKPKAKKAVKKSKK